MGQYFVSIHPETSENLWFSRGIEIEHWFKKSGTVQLFAEQQSLPICDLVSNSSFSNNSSFSDIIHKRSFFPTFSVVFAEVRRKRLKIIPF